MDDNPVKQIARQQLDRRLERIRAAAPALRLAEGGGWIATLRTALGMTQADLARRVGVSRQAVSQLEQREADGSATLKALEEGARALGGELVYAVVLEHPIEETLERRALTLAKQMTGSVRHTMRLEDQEPVSDVEERTRQLARELLSSPHRLWSGQDEP